jgi:alpha-ketoglutarate-dependent taurine dioxygenase
MSGAAPTQITLPQFITVPDGDDASAWVAKHAESVISSLTRHGALLFRGLGLKSVDDFERFASVLCPGLYGEYGDLPPERGLVYRSTPYPKDQTILFHNEASHTHCWPMKQFFFCVKPADQGGNTPIVDCRRVHERLDPAITRRFAQRKLLYVRTFNEGLDVSWQAYFRASTAAEVEDICRRSGTECIWHESGELTTRQLCHGVARHPRTGEWVFFNQVQLHHISSLDPETRETLLSLFPPELQPRNVYYGDGSPIEDSVMEEINAVYWELASSTPWQAGDVMVLDNMLTAHARAPFSGERKILVAMGDMMTRDQLRD